MVAASLSLYVVKLGPFEQSETGLGLGAIVVTKVARMLLTGLVGACIHVYPSMHPHRWGDPHLATMAILGWLELPVSTVLQWDDCSVVSTVRSPKMGENSH